MEMNLDRLMQPEQHHILTASDIIHRRATIRAKPSSLMANYSKIKGIESLWSRVGTAMEGIWNLKEQKDIEEVEEKTREAKERGSRKAR